MAKTTDFILFVCLAVMCILNVAAPVRMKSDIFEWTYDLDDRAPILTTGEQVSNTSQSLNHMVRVDKVNGTIMLIEHIQKRQVATLDVDVAHFAEDIYQNDVKHANITAIMQEALSVTAALIESEYFKTLGVEHVDLVNAASNAAAPYTASASDNSVDQNQDARSNIEARGLRWCNWCFIDWLCHYNKCVNPAKCYFIACLEHEY